MTSRRQTRSIAVLGGGIVGFAAAAAFRRALPDAVVTVFSATDADAEIDYAGAAAAFIHPFHRLVGIDPALFRRRTGAVTVAEAEFRHMDEGGLHLVGLADIPHVDGAALHQLWLRRVASGGATPEVSWAQIARRARRRDDPGLGERFAARAYRDLLAELTAHLGVTVARDTASEDLAASADLVIETRAESASDASWQRVEGVAGTWTWQPGAGGKARGEVESVELDGGRAMWECAAWHAELRADPQAPPAGRVREPWQGNRLRLGRAAVQCETFDGQPLSVALAGIARALELLPRPGASGHETAEYNRRSALVHDFLLDWAAERLGAPADVLPGRAALRAQFAHRGRIPFRDEDPVPAGHWIGWLLGCGERPRHIDPTALALPAERLAQVFARA